MSTAAGTFGFFGACAHILSEMVSDKETRMRESLRIMNLNRWSYALSFFITQSIFAMFTALIMFLSFYAAFEIDFNSKKLSTIDKNGRQYVNLFFGFQLLGINLVAFCMAMSTFFTDSLLSVLLGLFLLIIPPCLSQFSMIAIISDSLMEI